MFEKFTEKAKRILFLARYEASQQGGKVIGTEHLLLGLLKEGEETTRELFTRANVSMDLLQAELERRNPPREKLSTSVEIPFSEETKKVLQCAEEEAERLMHPHIGTEHLLLGLLRLEDSVAGRMLVERGMRMFAVREDVVNIYKRRPLPKKKKETPPAEPVDPGIRDFYRSLLDCLRHPDVPEGDWRLLECRPAWDGNWTWDCFIAFSWEGRGGRRRIVAVNYADHRSQCYVPLSFEKLARGSWMLRDLMGGASYARDGASLASPGLYLDLPEWGYHVFEITNDD